MIRKMLLPGLLCLLAMLLTAPLLSRTASAAEAPQFMLSREMNSPAVEDNVTIAIHADRVTDLYAYELTLSFDPNRWAFVEALSDLADYGAIANSESLADGIVTFVSTKIGHEPGENGSVSLGHITLKAKASGSSQIRLTGAKLVDSAFAKATYSPNVSIQVPVTGDDNGNPPGGDNGNPPGGDNGNPPGGDNGNPPGGDNGNPPGGDNGNPPGGDNGNPSGGDNGNPPGGDNGNPSGGDNGSSSGDNDNGGGQTADAGRQVVDPDDVRPNGKGVAIVEVESGKREVLLPVGTSDLADLAKLELQSDGVSLSIDPVVLKSLSGLVDAAELADAHYSVKIERTSETERDSLVGQGVGGGATVKAAGAVYRLSLSIVTKDGKESRLEAFEQPIEIALPYEEGADEDTLGVYYFNETTEAWEYVGGVVDRAGRRIVAQLNHFSVYAVLEYDKTFADVPANHWAAGAIRTLAARHVVSGVTDDKYAPGEQVTRAEFAALLTRALGLKPKAAAPFGDVAAGAWYADAVAAAYEAKLIAGQSDRSFAPGAPITREEMAAMIVRAFEYGTGVQAAAGSAAAITDAASVSDWAIGYVNAAVGAGLMNGTGGGQFAPAASTTRGQAAVAVRNLLAKIEIASASGEA